MAANKALGKVSIAYDRPVLIKGSGSIVGQSEKEGPLGDYFDKVSTDKNDMFGADSWEKAESALQKEAVAITSLCYILFFKTFCTFRYEHNLNRKEDKLQIKQQ